jgi:hypothetical protein
MELDKNDFELLIDSDGVVHLRYKLEGEKSYCLCIKPDSVDYSVVRRPSIVSGAYGLLPRRILSGAVIAAHHSAELSKKTSDNIKQIINNMIELITKLPEESVLSDSCASKNTGGQCSDIKTSQAGAVI